MKIDKLKLMEDRSVTAIVTVFPKEQDEKLTKELFRVLQNGGHLLGATDMVGYTDHCVNVRKSSFEIRDKIDYYSSEAKAPDSLFEYLVTMVKMPELNCILDPFPELTKGKVKKACKQLGIECIEL